MLNIESAPLFDTLLDPDAGGFFALRPAETFRATRQDREDSNVLETVMWTVPVGTIGEETSLRVLSSRRCCEVVKQIEGPNRTDPIMRRRNADREEKRVTRGNGTINPTGALDPPPKKSEKTLKPFVRFDLKSVKDRGAGQRSRGERRKIDRVDVAIMIRARQAEGPSGGIDAR